MSKKRKNLDITEYVPRLEMETFVSMQNKENCMFHPVYGNVVLTNKKTAWFVCPINSPETLRTDYMCIKECQRACEYKGKGYITCKIEEIWDKH